MVVAKGISRQTYVDLWKEHQNFAEVARILGVNRKTVEDHVKRWLAENKIEANYDTEVDAKTPKQAWDEHTPVFERRISALMKKRWPKIQRTSAGAYVIFHATDEHLDDDACPLKIIEDDIKASHGMGAIMAHGGDLLNNWPMAGRLAKLWAEQTATRPDGLLRAQHFIDLFKPDVWTQGNHEAFNPYLDDLFKTWLSKKTIIGDWSATFQVISPGGRTLRAILSHKFQKGGSWFHKTHGHIREMLEGEPADLLMDGHLHSDGVLDHTLPERQHAALCVASSGYKVADKFAHTISKGGNMPKLRGRAHWIVVDPQADFDANFCSAFKDPLQAEAYLNGLQNLRAA